MIVHPGGVGGKEHPLVGGRENTANICMLLLVTHYTGCCDRRIFIFNPSNALRTMKLSMDSRGVCGISATRKRAALPMFLILAVVLVVMWLGGFVMFKSAGLLIHLLLLFAIISLILHFVTGSRSAV